MKQQENKLFWADELRVFATYSVMVIHASAGLLYQPMFGMVWWTGNILDGATRFCVPAFLMLTGALLLPKDSTLSEFIKRRFTRILIPFLFWSAVYIIYHLTQLEPLGSFGTVKWLYKQILRGASFHLWYIYMIIGIYLFIPIIGKWARQATEKEVLYFLSIWIVTLCINQPALTAYIPGFGLLYFSGYLGYVVLGYYLTDPRFEWHKKIARFSWLFVISGIAITILGTYYLSYLTKTVRVDFYSYIILNVMLAVTGIFLLFKNRKNTTFKTHPLIAFLSKYSFGIYLVHVLVLTLLAKVGISWKLMYYPAPAIIITTVLCLFISAGIIYLLHKLPYGKFFAG